MHVSPDVAHEKADIQKYLPGDSMPIKPQSRQNEPVMGEIRTRFSLGEGRVGTKRSLGAHNV